jgi:uncharacterized membrane protein
MSYKVTAKRHIAKTISYRFVSTGIGFAIMWWATGSIKVGAAFGVVELFYKPIQYYIHERIWYRWIKFGLIEEKKPKPKKVQLNDVETKVLEEVQPEKSSGEPTNTVPPTGKKVLSYSSNR